MKPIVRYRVKIMHETWYVPQYKRFLFWKDITNSICSTLEMATKEIVAFNERMAYKALDTFHIKKP